MATPRRLSDQIDFVSDRSMNNSKTDSDSLKEFLSVPGKDNNNTGLENVTITTEADKYAKLPNQFMSRTMLQLTETLVTVEEEKDSNQTEMDRARYRCKALERELAVLRDEHSFTTQLLRQAENRIIELNSRLINAERERPVASVEHLEKSDVYPELISDLKVNVTKESDNHDELPDTYHVASHSFPEDIVNEQALDEPTDESLETEIRLAILNFVKEATKCHLCKNYRYMNAWGLKRHYVQVHKFPKERFEFKKNPKLALLRAEFRLVSSALEKSIDLSQL